MIRTTRLRTALLASGAAFAFMANPALASEIEDLDAQIDQLQSHLDQLKKQRSGIDAKQAAAPADAVLGATSRARSSCPGPIPRWPSTAIPSWMSSSTSTSRRVTRST